VYTGVRIYGPAPGTVGTYICLPTKSVCIEREACTNVLQKGPREVDEMGRRPISRKMMTPAQRQQRWRTRKRHAAKLIAQEVRRETRMAAVTRTAAEAHVDRNCPWHHGVTHYVAATILP
jgi:hypothetical protein